MPKMMKMMVKNGTYQKNGEEKNKWQQIGMLFVYDDGNMQAKMDVVPVGNEWDGSVKFFEMDSDRSPKQSRQQPQPKMSNNPFDDDVPF